METLRLAEVRGEFIPWGSGPDPRVLDIWRALLAVNPQAPVYQYPEWTLAVYHAGIIRPRGVLLLFRADRPIALLALHRRLRWHWETAAHLSGEYAPLLLDPQHAETAWGGLAEWVRQTRGMVHFGLTGDLQQRDLFRYTLQGNDICVRTPAAPPSMCIPLAESWHDYYAGLPRSTRSNINRAEAALPRDFPDATIDVITDPYACARPLAELSRLFRQHWGDQAGGTIFDNLHNVACYREVVGWVLQMGYGAIHRLRIGGEAVVVLTVFHIPGSEHAYFDFMGRDLDALPRHYSPGLVLMAHAIRWLIARGATSLHMGWGDSAYKHALGGVEEPLWEMIAARSPLGLTLVPRLTRNWRLLQRLPIHAAYRLRRSLKS